LNVTEQAELRPAHLRRLAELAGSGPDETIDAGDSAGTRSRASNHVVRFLSDALRFKMETLLSFGQGYLGHMHDPFALALALDASLGETRPGTVDVELSGRLTRGMTVVDRLNVSGDENNAQVWKVAAGDSQGADILWTLDSRRFKAMLKAALL
jgi:purine nucleosidase